MRVWHPWVISSQSYLIKVSGAVCREKYQLILCTSATHPSLFSLILDHKIKSSNVFIHSFIHPFIHCFGPVASPITQCCTGQQKVAEFLPKHLQEWSLVHQVMKARVRNVYQNGQTCHLAPGKGTREERTMGQTQASPPRPLLSHQAWGDAPLLL
jgi:hypothetical protein